MNPLINQILDAQPGSFFGVTIRRPLKVRKGVKDLIEKESVLTVRGGVSYDNLKRVKEDRESGEKPAENQGLPWGKWEVYPWKLSHKGVSYIRLTLNPSSRPISCYRINGVMTTKNDAEKYCPSSEFRDDDRQIEVITVKESNIVAIRGAD